jgi:hypothetical protein
MDHPWKEMYDWRDGRWQGIEDAAQYVEGLQGPLEPKKVATMLRALIDVEEKTAVAPSKTPDWKEYILAAIRFQQQG